MQRTTRRGRRTTRLTVPVRCIPGLLAISLCSAAAASAQDSVESDRAALMALYDATGGPNWSDNANWDSDAPLREWAGVITDVDGRVTHLFLVDNGLSGPLPAALGSLTRLAGLSLGGNTLTGNLPVELRNLVNLEELVLSGNLLTGAIPEALGELANLEKLRLAVNSFTGPIPEALGELVRLEELDLSGNSFTGSIPAALGNLTNLTALFLANSAVTGPIPEALGNMTSLRILFLGNGDVPSGGRNALTGRVPSTLGNLRNLDLLWLQANRLEGELPASLTNLSLDGYLGSAEQPTLRFEDNAGLCAPMDDMFQAWLDSLPFGHAGPRCGAVVPAVPAAGLMLLGLMLIGAGMYARRSAA